MLTVKHIRFDGAETIDHAERVIFYPSEKADVSNTPSPHWGGTVSAVGAISGGVDWRSGLVYVMNENGSTIAKYDLGQHPAQYPQGQNGGDVNGDALGVALAA